MKSVFTLFLLFSLFLLFPIKGKAQVQDSTILQLSGAILDQETLQPLSYITVRIKGTVLGVVSNYDGFFSLPLHRKDTLVFTSVGYEPYVFVLDPKAPNYKYFVSIRMKTSIFQLKGVVIRGLTREQFKREFFTIKLPKMPEINPAARVHSAEIEMPPPPPGYRFSPSALIEQIPFVQKALKKKRSKKFSRENTKDIPLMK